MSKTVSESLFERFCDGNHIEYERLEASSGRPRCLCWVEALQCAPRLCGRKSPMDGGLGCSTASFPGGNPLAHTARISEALVETLLGQHCELDFGHVEPTPMLGRVAQVQFAQDTTGLSGCEGFIEGRWRMGVQVSQNHAEHPGLGDMRSHQVLHTVGEVLRRAAGRHLEVPPALERLKDAAQAVGRGAIERRGACDDLAVIFIASFVDPC